MFTAIRTASLALALAASFVASQTVSAAVVYDAGVDFSATDNGTGTNPNWSYGHITGLDTTTFAKFSGNPALLAGVDFWSDGVDPNIESNRGATTISGFGITFLPGQIVAGPFQGPADLRFTVPAAGAYSVSALFTAVQFPANTDAQGFLFINGVQQFTGVADAIGSGTLIPSVNLASGDTVDFIVAGSQLGFGNKSTQINATLTLLPAVPEPATLSVLGLASLGLVMRRRAR